MTQQTVSIEIASPCAMPWDKMKGNDQVRYCTACKLNVYNAMEMTDFELIDLIRKREGRMCVRILQRQDGTVITRDCATARIYRGVKTLLVGLAAIWGGVSLVSWFDNMVQESSRSGGMIFSRIQTNSSTEVIVAKQNATTDGTTT